MSLATTRAKNVDNFVKEFGLFRTEILYPGGRPIAGTSTLSEHSFGNAVDIFGSTADLDALAVVLDQRRREFSIATLCWDGGITSYDKCTTPHMDHIHVDFSPRCGRIVAGNGSDQQRVNACERYQTGEAGVVTPPDLETDTGIDLFGIGGFMDGIEGGLMRAVMILGGIAVAGGAMFLILNDLKSDVLTKVIKGVTK